MCSHYQAVETAERLRKYYDAHRPPIELPADMWPRYQGLFIRRPVEWDSGDEAVPAREAVAGRWGLISAMVQPARPDEAGKLSTFYVLSETAATSTLSATPGAVAMPCRPASRAADGHPPPLAVAGLLDRFRNAPGGLVDSFSMSTANAADHSLFRDCHKANDEKHTVSALARFKTPERFPGAIYDSFSENLKAEPSVQARSDGGRAAECSYQTAKG